MANQITTKSAEPSNIKRIDIISNKDGQSVSVVGGTIRLLYYESILQDSIRATVVFADAGNTIKNKTALDGLPIVGQFLHKIKRKVIVRDTSSMKLLKDLNSNQLMDS